MRACVLLRCLRKRKEPGDGFEHTQIGALLDAKARQEIPERMGVTQSQEKSLAFGVDGLDAESTPLVRRLTCTLAALVTERNDASSSRSLV